MAVVFKVGWTVVAFALSILRLHGMMDNRYQAIAHLVEGAWIGTWCAGRMIRYRWAVDPDYGYYGWLALACGLVEVFAFVNGIGRIDGR
jgi:hypothetical protein